MYSKIILVVLSVIITSGLISIDDVFGDEVINTIDVGVYPYGIAVNSNTNIVYVNDYDRNSVLVIDGDTKTVIGSLYVGIYPYAIAVNSNTNEIYVSDYTSNDIIIIDGDTKTIIDTIEVVDYPYSIAVNSNTNRIYVISYVSDSVLVIDGDTKTVIDTIDVVGFYPHIIAVNSNTNEIYVVGYTSNEVMIIDGDTKTVIDTIDVGFYPHNLAVNSNTNEIYLAGYTSNDIIVIDGDTKTVVGSLYIADYTYSIAVNSNTNEIYLGNHVHHTISVIGGGTNNSDSLHIDDYKKNGGGCVGDCTPPTFGKDSQGLMFVQGGFSLDENTVDVENWHVDYPMVTVNTNQTHNMKLKVFESTALKWLQVGFGIPEIGSTMNDAEVIALFRIGYDDILDDIEIFDKGNMIDITSVSLDMVPCVYVDLDCYLLNFDFTPREQMKNNVIKIDAVDVYGYSVTNYINDGMIVVGDSLNEPLLDSTIVPHISHYPQRAGTVQLTQLDYKTNTWKDEYGYLWEYDNTNKAFNFVDIISLPPRADPIYSVMDRMNSNFADIIIQEQQRASVYYQN